MFFREHFSLFFHRYQRAESINPWVERRNAPASHSLCSFTGELHFCWGRSKDALALKLLSLVCMLPCQISYLPTKKTKERNLFPFLTWGEDWLIHLGEGNQSECWEEQQAHNDICLSPEKRSGCSQGGEVGQEHFFFWTQHLYLWSSLPETTEVASALSNTALEMNRAAMKQSFIQLLLKKTAVRHRSPGSCWSLEKRALLCLSRQL